MRSWLLALGFASLGFAGCLSVDTPDGALRCSTVPGRACPEHYYCLVTDDKCWRDGHFPDMTGQGQFIPGDQDFSIPAEEDMSVPADLSVDDAGLPDDLSQSD